MTSLPLFRVAGFLCLLCVIPAQAQHWNFQMFGPEQGLTNLNVETLHQDGQGFIWVSTEGGLFRYDGDRFQPFPAERPGKPGEVESLYSSADGQLWAGSFGGLFRWNGHNFAPVPGFEGVELENRESIGGDAANLYLATPLGVRAMSLKAGGAWRTISPKPSSAVFAAPDGTLWFGCGARLCSIRDGREREWGEESGLGGGPWRSIVEDGNKRLWVRSAERVLVRESDGSRFHEVGGLRKFSTHGPTLLVDGSGQVMVPHAGGLAICEGERCTNYGSESGLRKAEVFTAVRDREGSLWIGYGGQGVGRQLGRQQWQSFGELEGLANPGIWRIVRDAAGGIWIGTNRGLYQGRLQSGRWRFQRSSAVGELTVYGLAAEPDGSLWIGTYQTEANGLVRYYPGTGKRVTYPPPPGVRRLVINEIHRDDGGTVWVATPTGLLRLQPGSAKLEAAPVPLDGASIADIKSRNQDLFLSGKKGLYLQQGSRRRLLTVADGLKENYVQSMTVGPGGELWLTYFSAPGITRIDLHGSEFRMRHFTKDNGLPGNVVYSQFFDAGGRHWLGTDNGVAVLEGNRWTTYDTSDGLVWNDCNAHAFLAEADQAVWIGTSDGLSRFVPAPPRKAPLAETMISSVLRNDQPTESVDFDSKTHSLTFRFTMRSYERQNARFRYRIGSESSPWAETTAHEVRFAELPAGRYRFEVQGETPSGAWSKPAVMRLRLHPPWFLSSEFQVSLPVLLAVLLWNLWRQRDKRQRALREELEARVTERTRQLQAEVQAKKVVSELAESLIQRDRMVESVRYAAQQFLSLASWRTVIGQVLAKVGLAAKASRVFVFESDAGDFDGLAGTVCYQWAAEDGDEAGKGANARYEQRGDDWKMAASVLRRGGIFWVADFDDAANPVPASAPPSRSSVLVPIEVAGRSFGFLAFENSVQERRWSDAEQDSFRAVAGMLGASIMQQRAQEELVRARDEAEQASRAKSTFLANMSHELRTPLTAIIGYSQMLMEDCCDTSLAHLRPDLETIERSGQMLLGLISDILDISKIEAGRMELNVQPIDILPVLQEVQSTVRPMTIQYGIDLQVHCEQNVSQADVDVVKFRQSLLNLVNNACKFTENGKVTVSVEEIRRDRRNFVAVRVADTGIGISQDDLSKLFQPFSQVDGSSTRKRAGTGLGLAISKKFCQMMGGDILVESELGRGSEFSILVPAAVATPHPPE